MRTGIRLPLSRLCREKSVATGQCLGDRCQLVGHDLECIIAHVSSSVGNRGGKGEEEGEDFQLLFQLQDMAIVNIIAFGPSGGPSDRAKYLSRQICDGDHYLPRGPAGCGPPHRARLRYLASRVLIIRRSLHTSRKGYRPLKIERIGCVTRYRSLEHSVIQLGKCPERGKLRSRRRVGDQSEDRSEVAESRDEALSITPPLRSLRSFYDLNDDNLLYYIIQIIGKLY